jgi:glycosyltransferase involved in cell wall biosynthesis
MQFDVSVVIPLYNAEKFIRACVDSVLNQTLKNVEVVIVDDCSTDGSLALCRELYGNNERVRIFQQPKNGGPGAARNRGVREAQGEYIAFLDSDDEMIPCNLERMFTTAKKYDADVLHNNQVRIMVPMDDGKVPVEMIGHQEDTFIHLFDMGEMIKEVQVLPDELSARLAKWKEGELHWFMGNKMFRRKFILENNIVVPAIGLAEDAVFSVHCLMRAKNYVLMPGGWVLFRINPESLTRSVKTVNSVIKAIDAQLEITRKLQQLSEDIPFLKDTANFNVVADTILDSMEVFSIRYGFQDVGEEALRADKDFAAFFNDNFGDNAPYVEFLCYQLHEVYPKLPKLFFLHIEALEEIKRDLKKAHAAGEELIVGRYKL